MLGDNQTTKAAPGVSLVKLRSYAWSSSARLAATGKKWHNHPPTQPGTEAETLIDSFFWRKLFVRTGLTGLFPSLRNELNGGVDYLRYYSDRTLALPLADLADTGLLPDIATPDSINLALGALRCDSAFGRGIQDRRPTSAWGDLELRSRLADQFHRDHGTEHDPANDVLITHGASGAFAAAIDAFLNPGDAAVLFDPTSPIFSIGLKHRRARIRWVPTWSDNVRLRFAMDGFAKAMRGAKLLVLADPANPTGCVLAPEDLEQIAFWARRHDVLIFQDASFDHWRSEPAKARLASLPHCEGRIVTCGSFAKSHGLVSARVGWLLGDRHLVRPCAAATMLSAPFVPSLSQRVALQALESGMCATTELREELSSRRAYARDRLEEIGFEPWPAAAGFFLWMPALDSEDSRQFAQRVLRETGVLVNPGSPFGPSGDKFIRISFAIDEGRLREGLDRLQRFVTREPAPSLPVAQLIP
jgi:aspartate/methionine/tyrosine aminotransferase